MIDMPINLVFINGLSAEAMRCQIEDEIARWGRYRGIPILPPGCEVTIVPLIPERFEPDIEDTP